MWLEANLDLSGPIRGAVPLGDKHFECGLSSWLHGNGNGKDLDYSRPFIQLRKSIFMTNSTRRRRLKHVTIESARVHRKPAENLRSEEKL